MRLYHTTTRANARAIAADGFRPSRTGRFGEGVYLADGYWLREEGHAIDPADAGWFEDRFRDRAVFAFDIPDPVLAALGTADGGYVLKSPGDPGYDPLADDPDAEEEEQSEWPVPAGVADRNGLGVVHWVGEHPLTPCEEERLLARGGRTPSAPHVP